MSRTRTLTNRFPSIDSLRKTACAGLTIGIALAVVAAHPLAFFLAEGITPMDPVTFGCVIPICLLTGGIAAIIPARRALSIDPMSALRIG